MFLQQLKFCRELPWAWTGRSQQGECHLQCLCLPPPHPTLPVWGVIWVSGSKSCQVMLSLGLDHILEALRDLVQPAQGDAEGPASPLP